MKIDRGIRWNRHDSRADQDYGTKSNRSTTYTVYAGASKYVFMKAPAHDLHASCCASHVSVLEARVPMPRMSGRFSQPPPLQRRRDRHHRRAVPPPPPTTFRENSLTSYM